MNDTRPKLLKLLNDPAVTLIVVEHKDRLTRFGYNYIEQLLKMQNRKEDLVQDFVRIVTSFCARLHGQRLSN